MALTGTRRAPSRPLNTTAKNPRTQHIEEANQVDSPFLRLPGNVRNQVYGLTLGGMIIHVTKTTDPGWGPEIECPTGVIRAAKIQITRYICCATPESTNTTSTICASTRSPHNTGCSPPPLGSAVKTFGSALKLLRVSRQIHNEAALLPYHLNGFIFTSPNHRLYSQELSSEWNVMSRAQLGAIRTLILHLQAGFRDSYEAQSAVENMASLQQLHVHAKVETSVYGIETHGRSLQALSKQDALLDGLQHFKKLDLKTVTVSIVRDVEACSFGRGIKRLTVEDCKAWGERVEAMVLDRRDQPAITKEESTEKRPHDGRDHVVA